VNEERRRQSGKRGKATRAASKGGFKIPKELNSNTLRDKKPPHKLKKNLGVNRMTKQNGGAKCGARKRGPDSRQLCAMPAGWGTSHPGIGCCKYHGGNAPNHIKSAARKEYRILFGTPMEINPLDALLWCIRVRAGEVKWLSDRMAELQQKDWIEESIMGKQFHLYARERQKALNDLARFSQQAISLGIAERAVKMAETYADLLARLIQGILGDLELTPEQRARAPMIVRRHLIAIDGGQVATAGTQQAQLALEAGRGGQGS